MAHLDREAKINAFWSKNKIFEKSVSQKSSNHQYVFYDGPPFATGLPHYGHILGLTSKDVFPRYWTMKGFRCERRWGWDCHGLPIENIAEKELEIKQKKGIEDYGVCKFNGFCRSKVLFFASEWKKTVERMGKWIEFDNSYKTMDNSYMESIWWIFKKLYDDKLIYEGKKILMYCPRCETPVAKAEIAMDKSYKDVTEKTATAKFKIKKTGEYMLAWTTTPWTLIGNVALAVNSKMDYVKIKKGSDVLILAKERLSVIKDDYKIIDTFKGSKLVGLDYEPLYNVAKDKKAYVVIDGGKDVTSEEGTGIVHLALYGEFDFEMITKHGLAVVSHIDQSGKLLLGPKEWAGTWFKNVDKLVIKDLDERSLLFEAKDHTHSYPFCYRCNTPLIYNAVNSWFINIQKVKDKLLKKAELINWYPSNIKEGMFNNIIETAPDWTISRNRFWATAIPAWKCSKCKNIEVIGSIKELKEKAVEKVSETVDLHKDSMDNIHLKCRECKASMSRVPEVIDCWFESGAMPYASKHYPFENKEWFNSNYPADFVSEYIGQVRAWFYYMHVMGVLVLGKPPFRNVVVTGNILAEDGSKMSKSKKNFPDPNLMFDKYGADALRFFLMNSTLMRAQDINFKEEGLKEVYRKVVMLLENVFNFYNLFCNNNSDFYDTSSKDVLDKWVISRVNLLVKEAGLAMDDYNTLKLCEMLIGFIDDLSTWYVRRSRDRFKQNDKSAVKTLAYTLNTLIKVMAPITPFISEEIYQGFKNYDKKMLESVHLEKWPVFSDALIMQDVNDKMSLARIIVNKALDERDRIKIPIRQPLNKLIVNGADLEKEYAQIISDEVNVKSVIFKAGAEVSVELDAKISDDLLREGIVRDLIRKINSFRKDSKLTIQDRIILYVKTDDKNVEKSVKEFEKKIKESVQANSVKFGETKNKTEFLIGDSKVIISIELI